MSKRTMVGCGVFCASAGSLSVASCIARASLFSFWFGLFAIGYGAWLVATCVEVRK